MGTLSWAGAWALAPLAACLFLVFTAHALADAPPSEEHSDQYVDAELYFREPAPATARQTLPAPTLYTASNLTLNPPTGPVIISSQPLSLGPLDGASAQPVGVYAPNISGAEAFWSWQLLPEGLIYRPYMAGVHEARISGVFYGDHNGAGQLDVTLGGHVPILRLGSLGATHIQGWQLDIEGAAFPRLNLMEDWDVDATDFRFGVPLTWGRGAWQTKFAYYHLSSHLGDERAIREPSTLMRRINYSRDALVLGVSHYPIPAVRLYGEAGYAYATDGGTEPWEFQFGADISPPGPTGVRGAPFVALNGHLREEVNFGGNFVLQAGWLWRGETGRALRTGLHYYNGKSNQFQFFNQFEEQIGFGIWYDY